MTLNMILLLIIIVIALVLFAIDIVPADVVALGIMMTLILTGIIPADVAFSGFGSDTAIMILGLLILTGALVRTGVIQIFSRQILRRVGENKNQLYWVIMGTASLLSGFMSNTATSAFFTPMVIGLSRRYKIHPSKMLMSLAFATILASSLTLVGTSTNVVVSGFLTDYDMKPLGMFELTPVGVPILIVGLLYMYFIGRHLVPIRDAEDLGLKEKILPYCSEFEITDNSAWKGKTLSEIGLGHEFDLTVLRILKEPGYSVVPRANTVLQKGDKVLIEGDRDDLVALKDQESIEFTGEFKESEEVPQDLSLAEVIVLPGSPLIGRTLWGLSFRQRYGLQVLGINRNGETIYQRISRTRIKVGDQLLIQGDPDTIRGLGRNNNFRVVTAQLDIVQDTRRAPLAVAIFSGVLLLVSFNILSLPVAVMLGVLIAFLTRCISPSGAYQQVNWNVWFLIASMLALGHAMEISGLAELLANQIVDLVGAANPVWLLAAFFFLSLILTQPMSNQAAAVVIIPIALQTAIQLGLNPRTFAVMIALGASCSFITPLEPAALIVYGAGNYRFFDFIKVGSILTILIFLISIFMVPWLWPL